MKRTAILIPLLLIAVGAIVAVVALQSRATASHDAQLRLAAVQFRINELQDIPWGVARHRSSPEEVRRDIDAARLRIERDLAVLGRDHVAAAHLDRAGRAFRQTIAPLLQVVTYTSQDDLASGTEVALEAWDHSETAIEALEAAGREYGQHAERALMHAVLGSTAAIALLFAAFAVFLRRSVRARGIAEQLAGEVHELLEVASTQATTDALTGLANRRALSADLATALESATPDDPVVLALFDLDGFKSYNDTFGHPAGDALLKRLGNRLRTTLEGLGTSYRIGGDEFCVLALAADSGGGESIVRLAAAALSDEGEGFSIGCSYGIAHLPTDADSPEAALGLVDQRMYGQKTSGRASASRQSADVLVKVLGERSIGLQSHIDDVARLAAVTARRLQLPDQDVHTIQLAAELHDLGKVAIPDAILNKPGELTEEEWAFMRRHTIIGERIALAAPSLTHTAALIRASHERIDGTGYPDRLRGDQIPLGARIIAVCDAYDAMISDRPYGAGISAEQAVAELQRCAGTQFDPEVVDVFTELVEEGLAEPHRSSPVS